MEGHRIGGSDVMEGASYRGWGVMEGHYGGGGFIRYEKREDF